MRKMRTINMSLIKIILEYLIFIIKAKNKHSVHSPFVFHFITEIINKNYSDENTKRIENLKKELCKSKKTINILDFGAGSFINRSKKRKVKDIARKSGKNKKFGRLLYRIIKFLKPNNIIELGTSLGISTCYLAKGNSKSKIFSFEGCPETIKIAKDNLNEINVDNVKLIEGDFNITLLKELKKIKKIDVAFIDGNHQEKPTLKYYNDILKYSTNETIIIFDDINWSIGMQNAWGEIKKHPKTKVTIDLFFIGIVFIKKELSKEHFKIRF